jgi:hypothetical protein
VFEHGTWIYRLTCWTCRDCRTVVGVAASDVSHDAETPVPNRQRPDRQVRRS